MAINYTVSYTFSPSTTISSSQVNTNFSDNANTWTGLEALTKSFAKLKIDVDPATALEVATKQYVDHYSAYKRPVLQWGSITTVAVQSGIDGTSGDIPLLFPDGSMRTETSTTRTTFDITRNAVLVTSGAQSGLTGATSEATNTWYALYGVKVTDSSTLWVTVGSTVTPIQANFSTLNTAYGNNGWVYLGMIRNGDNAGTTGDILKFDQAGNFTKFRNNCTLTATTAPAAGTLLATGTSTTISWAYASGTGAAQIPSHLNIGAFTAATGTGSGVWRVEGAAERYFTTAENASAIMVQTFISTATTGYSVISTANSAKDLAISGFWDTVLGVGSNPLL